MRVLDDFLETEVSIKSSALDALAALNLGTHNQETRVAIKFSIKPASTRRTGECGYEFPSIVNGDARMARALLTCLSHQGILTNSELTLMQHAIEIAEVTSGALADRHDLNVPTVSADFSNSLPIRAYG